MSNEIYRQGDVLILRSDSRPDGNWQEVPRDNGRVVLAYGEVTGHAHAFRDPGVCLLRAEGIHDSVLTIAREALLQHEEHSPISLPPGEYIVRRQVEYTPEEIRTVAD